jgi:hypothetical protein
LKLRFDDQRLNVVAEHWGGSFPPPFSGVRVHHGLCGALPLAEHWLRSPLTVLSRQKLDAQMRCIVQPGESGWTSISEEANDQIAGFPAVLGEAFHPVPINPRVAKNALKKFDAI